MFKLKKKKHKATPTNSEKERISAYLNKDLYGKFKQINTKRGVNNSRVLGLLIADYVEKNKIFLSDEEDSSKKMV